MNLYADSSAIVKRYLIEPGSAPTIAIMREASLIATSMLSRVEVMAALARGTKMGALSAAEASHLRAEAATDWSAYLQLRPHNAVLMRAETFAWQYGLRAYDAVHLASAVVWQEAMDEPVVVATFDRQLWSGGIQAGLRVFPDDLDHFRGRP